jgi:hypothetical protein
MEKENENANTNRRNFVKHNCYSVNLIINQ